ncbi:MAG: hypothetical protein EOP10_15230 [Proteobacteria bacterium]|nr:MAG: hypothetical protein EOP10_15230 [Pseudomonadota bacterium]
MTLNRWLFSTLLMLLTACQAYRAKPESNVLYTRHDLTKKGFVLAPIAVAEQKLNPGAAELTTYDSILTNTLVSRWPDVPVLSSGEVADTLGTEELEMWRKELQGEEVAIASPSSFAILKKIAHKGKRYPKQVLLPSLLMNTVSCGQKEALSTAVSPNPHGIRAYCQRIVKMRFRIMSVDSAELLWNGLIYATQEMASEIEDSNDQDAERKVIEPPATQALIRDCFNNFAKQFSEP